MSDINIEELKFNAEQCLSNGKPGEAAEYYEVIGDTLLNSGEEDEASSYFCKAGDLYSEEHNLYESWYCYKMAADKGNTEAIEKLTGFDSADKYEEWKNMSADELRDPAKGDIVENCIDNDLDGLIRFNHRMLLAEKGYYGTGNALFLLSPDRNRNRNISPKVRNTNYEVAEELAIRSVFCSNSNDSITLTLDQFRDICEQMGYQDKENFLVNRMKFYNKNHLKLEENEQRLELQKIARDYCIAFNKHNLLSCYF